MHRKTKINELIKLRKNVQSTSKINLNRFFDNSIHKYISDIRNIFNKLKCKEIIIVLAYQNFKSITDRFLEKCIIFEEEIKDKKIIKKKKMFFRKLVGSIIFKGKLTSRAYNKPRGYPGDYKIIEAIYDNQNELKSWGDVFDRYLLQDQYAQAIRARKEKMKDLLVEFLRRNHSEPIKILNFGCGSCREIREVLQECIVNKKIYFDFVDQDGAALYFSKNQIRGIISSGNIKDRVNVRFSKINVLDLLADLKHYKIYFGEKDFVYNMGLADYLPDSILSCLIKFSFDLLKPRGQLIVAHKDIKKYRPIASDWFCDWGNFYSRDERDILWLITKALDGKRFILSSTRDKTDRILFVVITNDPL